MALSLYKLTSLLDFFLEVAYNSNLKKSLLSALLCSLKCKHANCYKIEITCKGWKVFIKSHIVIKPFIM